MTTIDKSPAEDGHHQLQHLFEELQRRHLTLTGRQSWTNSIAMILAAEPRQWWRRWLPYGFWRKAQMRKLRREGLFDPGEYLRHNPDVERSGIDPLVHLLHHGFTERRPGIPWLETALLTRISDDMLTPTSDDMISEIRSSGLFDHDWYRLQNPDASADPDEAIAEYLERSLRDPLHVPGPLFSGVHYLFENPDTHSIHPLQHLLRHGMAEGRRAFAPDRADAFMDGSNHRALDPIASFLDKDREILILHWQDGNFFFSDIAHYLTDFLSQRGYRCRCLTNDSALLKGDHDVIVVAPHEYCIHGPGRDWPDDRFRRAIHVNTEQWHTSWFTLALKVMMRSRRALDINPASARGLQRLGITTGFLPLLATESAVFRFDRAPLSDQTVAKRYVKPLTWPERFAERPYDVLFVGALNERREKILAALAPVLAQYDSFIHSPRLQGPVTAQSGNMIPSRDVAQLARNAKLLLNIHQGESRYFEWHRLFVSGICEGCVVVSEPCVPIGVLEPGVHYLECEAGTMSEYLEWLLGTDEGRKLLQTVHDNCEMLIAALQAGKGFQS